MFRNRGSKGRFRVGLLFTLACGCGSLSGRPTGPEPTSQDEVGAVHLTVVSVAPWGEYVESLQPHFELTADEALDEVLRVGQLRRRAEVDSAGLSVGALQEGDSAKAPGAPAAGEARPRPGSLDLLARDAKRDAMTDYWAATALYQEVQLLNRYVYDAAIPKGYDAYVVRLQVTLLPRYRGAPYDAYSSISFFTTGDGLNRDVSARGTGDSGESGDGDSGESGDEAVSVRAPRVLPLLVTDNFEAALASDEFEKTRRLALAAAGTAGTTQLGVGADLSRGLVEQTGGLDLNSLLTVTRLSENTLRVRLGAMQQGSQRFAMVPRTHKITVLVMVPAKSPASLQVVARTEMVHAETGRVLQPRTAERLAALEQQVAADYGLEDPAVVGELFRLAQRNEQDEFLALADEHGVEHGAMLWVDTLGMLSGGQYSSTVVDLDGQRLEVHPAPPPIQTVLLVDDGENVIGELVGGRHLGIAPVDVVLEAGDKQLPGVRVVPVEGGRGVRFSCRSLAKHKLDPSKVRIRLRVGGETYDYEQIDYRAPKPQPVKPQPAKPPAPK